MSKRKEAKISDMNKVMLILATHGKDGMTAGHVANIAGRSKGWAFHILSELCKEGEVYRCETKNGWHGMDKKILYFTTARIQQLNDGRVPEVGRVYIIKQRTITEIERENTPMPLTGG